jgi:hypothetical protein
MINARLIERLSENDRLVYYRLKDEFALPRWRAPRHGAAQTFHKMLQTLKQFVMKNDEEDAQRAAVVGIIWTETGVVINASRLSEVLSRSKSSINGSFHSLGYGTLPIGHGIPTELLCAFPLGHRNFSVLRHWTVRRLIEQSTKEIGLTEIVRDSLQEQHNAPAESAFDCDEAMQEESDFDFPGGTETTSPW